LAHFSTLTIGTIVGLQWTRLEWVIGGVVLGWTDVKDQGGHREAEKP